MEKKMSYHGKSADQAAWVLDWFGKPETQEMHKDNKSFQEWMETCKQIVEARRLDY